MSTTDDRDRKRRETGGDATSGRERPWWASGSKAGGGGDPDWRFEDNGDGGSDDMFGRGRPRSEGPGATSGGGHHHATHEACQICPICSLLRTLDDVRPEVVEHLGEAARHLTLAAKSFIDAQAAGYGPKKSPFERIDLDDE